MKAFKLISSLVVLGAIATPLVALPASAEVTAQKDSEGAVYLRGLTPQQSVDLIFTGTTQSKQVVANACGLVMVKGSAIAPLPSVITVGTSTVTLADLPLGLVPKCTAGALEVPVSANFKTSKGEVVVIGQTANTAIAVSYAGDKVKKTSANACGFARLKSSASFNISGSFTVPTVATPFDVATLAVALPPLCRNGVTYLPAQ
jgi:hypothetical protein